MIFRYPPRTGRWLVVRTEHHPRGAGMRRVARVELVIRTIPHGQMLGFTPPGPERKRYLTGIALTIRTRYRSISTYTQITNRRKPS